MPSTIITKNGSGAPLAADLVAGELAVDLTNGRLYTEDSGGSVIEIGLNPSGNVDVTGTVTSTSYGSQLATTLFEQNVLKSSVTASSGAFVRMAVSSAANPTYAFEDDTDTGVFTSGANTLNFGTAGTERMRIDSSGNVGIGTASPLADLHLSSTSNTNIMISDSDAGTDAKNWDIRVDGNNFTLNNINDGNNASNTWLTAVRSGYTTDYISFHTGSGSERLRITSSGNLLVGTTSPINSTHTIQISGSSTNALVINNSSGTTPSGAQVRYGATDPNNTVSNFYEAYGYNGTSYVLRFSVRSNGGIANYQANDANLSDERVKTDIAPLGSMWDKFKAIEIVTFKYKDQTHDDDNIGVIAQQVEAVAPEFVDNDGFGETPEGEEPLKAIYTADLYHAAIKALQEAMDRIETLEAKVAQLEGAN